MKWVWRFHPGAWWTGVHADAASQSHRPVQRRGSGQCATGACASLQSIVLNVYRNGYWNELIALRSVIDFYPLCTRHAGIAADCCELKINRTVAVSACWFYSCVLILKVATIHLVTVMPWRQVTIECICNTPASLILCRSCGELRLNAAKMCSCRVCWNIQHSQMFLCWLWMFPFQPEELW